MQKDCTHGVQLCVIKRKGGIKMKFNVTTKTLSKTTNYEGAAAFILAPEMELYTLVVTAGLSGQFYEAADDKLARLRTLIAKNDPLFVARLAVYAREEMHLRSIPLVLTVELARLESGNSLIATLANRVIQRADEITELMAYYVLANERTGIKKLNKLSKQLQKGLAMAFNKFSAYQFAKYNRDAAIRLRDVLFVVHPKAKDAAQQELFNEIANNQLEAPYTWEVELSVLGKVKFFSEAEKTAAFCAKWEELIYSNKLGYMATLRNLRNILMAGISDAALEKVCGFIGDAKAVAASKQLPFRFLAAYREIKALENGRVGEILDALETAVLCSAANINGYAADTKLVIAADVSGSMQAPVSAKSKILNYDIGLMLAMLLQNRCDDVVVGMFGDQWKTITVSRKNILANVQEFYRREGEVGYATNGHLVIKDLLERRLVKDKIMLFTDCQLWNNNGAATIKDYWKQYKKLVPAAKLYLFDLAGYGKVPLNIEQNDVYLLAGWSDKIFDVLAALDKGGSALEIINRIVI